MDTRLPSTERIRRRQRGFSLVELMTGTALGLFIASGAISLFAGQLGSARRLMLEARVQQDLRSAADLMTRELRRSGYWGHALAGVPAVLPAADVTGTTANASTTASPPRNPYSALSADPTASTLGYSLSRDATENGAVDLNERFGLRLNRSEHTLQMLTGSGTWQTLTDPSVVTIPNDGMAITLTETPVDLRSLCPTACTGSDCPSLTVRQLSLTLKARATADPTVQRQLETRVRLRNDRLAGRCPA